MKRLVSILLAFAPAPCLAECPSVHVIASYTNFSTTASQLDTVIDMPAVGVSATVIYDLAQEASHTSVESGVGNGALSLECQDDFLIQGLADGTPVAFTAKFVVHTDIRGGSSHAPWFHTVVGTGPAGDPSHASEYYDGYFIGDHALVLALSQNAGEVFPLHFLQEYSEGLDGLDIYQDAKLTFEGLPPGATITSCHGYHQDAVPASHTTWGSLKGRY